MTTDSINPGYRLAGEVFLSVLLTMSVFIVNMPAASAHAWNAFHTNGRWVNNSNLHYQFRNTLPTADYTYQITNGFDSWNNAYGTSDTAEPDFYGDGVTTYYGSWNQPCQNDRNMVYWYDLDSLGASVIGAGLVCPYYGPNAAYTNTSTVNTRCTLAIDNDRLWYTGSGTYTGGALDLRSAATHEVGHLTGWVGHFKSPIPGVRAGDPECPVSDQANYHVMCDRLDPGWTSRENVQRRHDTPIPWAGTELGSLLGEFVDKPLMPQCTPSAVCQTTARNAIAPRQRGRFRYVAETSPHHE